MADVHLHSVFRFGGRSLAPQQRLGNAPVADWQSRPATPVQGNSSVGSTWTAGPMTLTNPAVLTPAILRHNATTHPLFHV
jgi:hypothetical protein